jgi:hypothetical protein
MRSWKSHVGASGRTLSGRTLRPDERCITDRPPCVGPTTTLATACLGHSIVVLNATTIGEIDAAFAALARERLDALLVAPDGSAPAAASKLAPTFGTGN